MRGDDFFVQVDKPPTVLYIVQYSVYSSFVAFAPTTTVIIDTSDTVQVLVVQVQ